MTKTANLDLPLVQAAQAQKHVTVNEALALLDGLCQLTLESLSSVAPPGAVVDGQSWVVPEGAVGEWSAHVGQLAVFSNGGWIYVTPRRGWRGWIKDQGQSAVFDGVQWAVAAVAFSPNGATTRLEVLEIDVTLSAGTSMASTNVIPENSVVFGVTGRVTQALTGSLATWRLGVPGQPDRYGSGLGTAQSSWAMGLSGQPLSYYSETALQLEAEGGEFEAGRIRLAVHLMRLSLPRA